MGLVDLPLEAVQAIMEETVLLVGLWEAVHLRLVSKLFDTEVQRAIYALETFDGFRFRDIPPAAMSLPDKMDPAMTTRLILSRMRTKNSEKRPLCLAMTRAVDHLENQFGQEEAGSRQDIIEALAGATAVAMPLYEIVDCLRTDLTVWLERLQWVNQNRFVTLSDNYPRVNAINTPIDRLEPTADGYTDSAPQDALIAALCTKRFQLAKQLLEGNMKAMTESPTFGVPLEVAAAMGAQEVVQMILDGLVAQEEDVDTPAIIRRAMRSVLEGAAAGGQGHIIGVMLAHRGLDQVSLRKELSIFHASGRAWAPRCRTSSEDKSSPVEDLEDTFISGM